MNEQKYHCLPLILKYPRFVDLSCGEVCRFGPGLCDPSPILPVSLCKHCAFSLSRSADRCLSLKLELELMACRGELQKREINPPPLKSKITGAF